MLTQAEALAIWRYDPETGVLTRLVSSYGRTNVPVSTRSHGYIVARNKGRNYLAHRLIWLMVTGSWPKDEIDHRNGIRSDNRWENLREATSSQNKTNRETKGYNFHPASGLWHVRISANGRVISGGYYRTEGEAAVASKALRLAHQGAFAYPRRHGV